VRIENKVADVLSRRVIILVAMSEEVIGFEKLREEYESCPDFGEMCVMLRDNFCSRDERVRWISIQIS